MKISRLACVFLSLSAVACVEPIVMDPLEEMPVVVNCILTRDGGLYEDHPEENRGYQPPVQYLDLFYARTPSQAGYKTIDEATVTVTGYGETHQFVWNGSRWECAFLPQMGILYQLKVKTADGHELSSEMTFPPDCRLRRYRLIDRASLDFFGNTFAGYYYLQKHYDDSHGVCHWDNFRDECFMWIRAMEKDVPVKKICTNHPGVDNFNVRRDVWGDCAVIDLYEQQFKSFMERENAAYERYNPSQNEGMVGFGRPIYVDPQLWERFSDAWLSSPLHDEFLRIHHPAGFDNGMHKPLDYYVANDFGDHQPAEPRDLFVLGADFDPSPKVLSYTDDEGKEVEYVLNWNYLDAYEVRFVSETYDKYLHSCAGKALGKDEFAASYSTDPVYSNIEGGLGCFGGQWITKIEISTGY